MSHPLSHLLHSRYNKIILFVVIVILAVLLCWLIFVSHKIANRRDLAAPVKHDGVTRALVLPHHDLLLEKFPDFYAYAHSEKPITKILLLSPNHFHQETTVAKTINQFFQLSDGQQVPVFIAEESWLKDAGLVIDTEVFNGEHGVTIHLPFIKIYFPNATVLPILLTRRISKDKLDTLINSIKPLIDENTLIIVSTDFSHYLTQEEAQKKRFRNNFFFTRK